MSATINSGDGQQVGLQLAERLGLKVLGREGHDLKCACIHCSSSDAMRVHQETGVAQCYSCGSKWSPYRLAEDVIGHEAAVSLMVELGVFDPPNGSQGNGASPATPQVDPVEEVARLKHVSAEALKRYGAKAKGRCVVFPMFGPDGNQCSTFTLSPDNGKGKNAKGRPAGLFAPSVTIEDGATVYLVEGVKDAAALSDLGYVAIGLPNNRLNEKFAGRFRGMHVVIVPDADKAGENGAVETAKVLYGVAASVKIAKLPVETKETKGADVRDVLAMPAGREKLAVALETARPVNGDGKPRKRRRHDPALPWRPFPTEVLPEPVRGYVRAGSHAMKCDEAYIALPLLAGLASAIGATRRITLKPGWNEPAVVWAGVVAESGTMKSPAQALALDPLRRAQEWQLEQIPELEAQYVRDKALYDADYQDWKRKGRAKGEPPPEKPEEPQVARYVVNDVTIEALAEILSTNPRGVLAACDELAAWLGAFDQYRSGRGSDAAKWLSIHRAEGLIVDRKTGAKKTIFVKRACVSVAGSIQPKTLHRALGDEYFSNGLAARLLMASPPRLAKRWSEATVDTDTYQAVERVYARLLALSFGTDENDQPTPIDVPLSPKAKGAWVTFYDGHAKATESMAGKMAAAYSKLEAYAARLALVLYLAKAVVNDEWMISNDTIDVQSMIAGITLAKWFAHEVERVYRIIEESDTETERRQIVEFIQARGGRITANDLRRRTRKFQTSEEAEAFLHGLVDAGSGYWADGAPSQDGGRPTRYFCVSVSETSKNPEENEV